MKKILSIFFVLIFASCSVLNTAKRTFTSVDTKFITEKYNLNKYELKHWENVIGTIVVNESDISDWYGSQNPLQYLRMTGTMTDKDLYFFRSLEQKNPLDITDNEFNEFNKIVAYYISSLAKNYTLKSENIKDPKGIVDLIVSESKKNNTISEYIKNNIATKDEWQFIENEASKKDVSENERKELTKIFNNFIKHKDFFNEKLWIKQGINDSLLEIIKLSKRENLTELNINNINSKALFLAYPGYFSKLERWN